MELEKLTGWQPIETAPKDGTEVLGYREDCGVLLMRWTSPAEFLTDAELADWSEEAAHAEGWFYADFLDGGRMEGDEAPTHWRPLPAPPGTTRAPADLRSALEAETIKRCARSAECAFDDRPRSRVGHPSQMDWEDGYRDGTRAAATAIRALAPTKGEQS